VGAGLSTAKDDVRVRITERVADDRTAGIVDLKIGVRLARALYRVHGALGVAVGGVLEAHRHRKRARELAVELAFHRPRSNGAPGEEITEVMRHDRIEKLGRARNA